MAHEEYLRRNILHAASVGSAAGIREALRRLRQTKRPQKWLLEMLDGALERADRIHPEMAKWRNTAPDSPHMGRE